MKRSEQRVCQDAPPAGKVGWFVRGPNGQTVRVEAQTWFDARAEGSSRLGLEPGLLVVMLEHDGDG